MFAAAALAALTAGPAAAQFNPPLPSQPYPGPGYSYGYLPPAPAYYPAQPPAHYDPAADGTGPAYPIYYTPTPAADGNWAAGGYGDPFESPPNDPNRAFAQQIFGVVAEIERDMERHGVRMGPVIDPVTGLRISAETAYVHRMVQDGLAGRNIDAHQRIAGITGATNTWVRTRDQINRQAGQRAWVAEDINGRRPNFGAGPWVPSPGPLR
jgi:hypothetical protein